MPYRRSAPLRAAIIVLLGLVLLMPLAAGAAGIMAATPIGRTDLSWWRARHEAKLKEIAQTRPDLIFLGNSITQNWEKSGPPDWQDFAPEWKRFYGDRNAVNLGFSGDTTASLLWRIRNGEVDDISPKAAVVLIGANNLGRVHWSAEDTVAGIDAIIEELRKRLPDTKILLLAVLPSDRSAWATETTVQINQMLAAEIPRLLIRELSRRECHVHAQGGAEPRSVLRSQADAASHAAAPHRTGHGDDIQGDRACSRHNAERSPAHIGMMRRRDCDFR